MVSLFAAKVPDQQANPLFLGVRDHVGYAAGRGLLDDTFARYTDKDGNFVKDFQTTGFSARIWELSLFAYLLETGLPLELGYGTPDYLIDGPHPLAIEAVTSQPTGGIAPSVLPPPDGRIPQIPDDLDEARAEFTFQLGKALRNKLLKRFDGGVAYWDLPQVRGKPVVLAVQAFHAESSLFHSVGFAAEYLYGLRWTAARDASGRLTVEAVPVTTQTWRGRSIPSGLFAHAEAEHLSAVLFSNSGTAAQFNRIGAQRGIAPAGVHIVRIGTCADPDPDADLPAEFHYVVGAPGSPVETSAQAMHVLHNPHARVPLPAGALPGATEHRLDLTTGSLTTTHHGFSPFSSITAIFTGPGSEGAVLRLLDSLDESSN